jgi:hypothetical protein
MSKQSFMIGAMKSTTGVTPGGFHRGKRQLPRMYSVKRVAEAWLNGTRPLREHQYAQSAASTTPTSTSETSPSESPH